MNTAIAIEDFPQLPWERVFSDPNAVYVFDNIHARSVPHWQMVNPADLPINDPDGTYRLDVGPGNSLIHPALFDLALEVRRILPTARIKIAPRLSLPDASGEMRPAMSSAATEFDTRPERDGVFSIPTLLLSSNQGVEEMFRETYRFLWMLIEAEIPFIKGVPQGTMDEIERSSYIESNAIFYDWLAKFPKLPGETKQDFLDRIAQERRALTFTNMAMDRLGGCWDDDQSPAVELRRRSHDLMFRKALRGDIGKMIASEYSPVPDEATGEPPSLSDREILRLLETEEWK